MTYRQWIDSPEFKALADRCKKRDGHRCRVCGSPLKLHAHHSTYDHLAEGGDLELADLTTLCAHHHAQFELERELPEPSWPEPRDAPLWDELDEFDRMREDLLPPVGEVEAQLALA